VAHIVKILAVISFLFLSACSNTTVITKDCLFAKVIWISQEDVLTLETAQQIEENNMNVTEFCD